MTNKMNTYAEMQALVQAGLATVSTNGNLDTFKYARKVMFEYLWKTDEKLLECRGHTYDNQTGELVVAAPRKSFNYLEDGWWADKPLDTPVVAYKKYNGFMACVSRQGTQGVISTTGSTKSDFVKMAEDFIPVANYHWIDEDYTWLYEIVHPDDPHIVAEPIGAHLLGARCKKTGDFWPHGKTEDTYIGTLKGILAIAEVNRGEGFMVYDLDNDVDRLAPAKVKTPYYVGKKKLMRLSKKNTAMMYNDPVKFAEGLPKMWQDVPRLLVMMNPDGYWNEMSESSRRTALEILKGK